MNHDTAKTQKQAALGHNPPATSGLDAGVGYIGSSLHALVFTKSGATVRFISLRRAHKTEVKRYEKARS